MMKRKSEETMENNASKRVKPTTESAFTRFMQSKGSLGSVLRYMPDAVHLLHVSKTMYTRLQDCAGQLTASVTQQLTMLGLAHSTAKAAIPTTVSGLMRWLFVLRDKYYSL